MQTEIHVSGIAEVIRLAVAPVFLLSGIGAMLAVMTNRLGRIIDRARILEGQLAGLEEREKIESHESLLRLKFYSRAGYTSHISAIWEAALLFSSEFDNYDRKAG
jgi:hypothetical protein